MNRSTTSISLLCSLVASIVLLQEIYRIKLPGSAKIGEGKPENQNHAIIFSRGEALQTIDMNQVISTDSFMWFPILYGPTLML